MKKKKYGILLFTFIFFLSFLPDQPGISQSPGNKPESETPVFPLRIEPDPRVEQHRYHFKDTGEEMPYVLFVSSKVTKSRKNPLIVTLHGRGVDANFTIRDSLVDMAEEGGYIVAGPLGYKVDGWYGIPMESLREPSSGPPNLAELSEKDVMNVLEMTRKEFNVDENRIYLLGYSMGGAGALFLGQKHSEKWAAVACIAPAVSYMLLPDRNGFLKTIRDAEIPLMIIHGDKDTMVPVDSVRQWVKTMKELKMEHEYIELTDKNHFTTKNDGIPKVFRFFDNDTKKK